MTRDPDGMINNLCYSSFQFVTDALRKPNANILRAC